HIFDGRAAGASKSRRELELDLLDQASSVGESSLTGPGEGEALGRGLVRADAHEVGGDPELREETLEVVALALEACVANAAAGVDQGAVSGTTQKHTGPGRVFEVAEDLNALPSEVINRVDQLF